MTTAARTHSCTSRPLQNSGLHAEDLKIGTRLRYEVEQTRDGRTNAVDVHTV